MDVRRTAQLVLLAVAVVSGGAAAFRYLSTRGVEAVPRTPGVDVTPATGPVGMRPFLRVRGFDEGTTVRVLFCAPGTSDAECAPLGAGTSGSELRANPIPSTLPLQAGPAPVAPGAYEIRTDPKAEPAPGADAGTTSFEVVPLEIGEKPRPRSYAEVDPRRLALGDPRPVAKRAPCHAHFAPDGRLAIGSTLLDPSTGVSVEVPVQGAELVWSPSRDRLAVVTPDRKEIRLAAPDGSEATVVTREARGLISSVTWAPDADRIAFSARSEPGVPGGPGAPTIFMLSLVTGERAAIGPGEAVAFSPVDGRLAVEAPGGVIELDDGTGQRTRLIEGRRPAWSPDGSLVAFLRLRTGDRGDAYVTRVDAPGAVPLRIEDACGVAFSADGTQLSSVTGDDAALSLRAIRVRGGA